MVASRNDFLLLIIVVLLHIINILVHATYYLGQIIQHQIKLDSPITPIYAGQLLLKPLQPVQDFIPGVPGHHAQGCCPGTLRLIANNTGTTTAGTAAGLLQLHNPHITTITTTGGFISRNVLIVTQYNLKI